MTKKTKNCGVLETLKKGPTQPYGCESQEERECCALAEHWLLEAKEPLPYRKQLLEALIRFKERIASDSEEFSANGEAC